MTSSKHLKCVVQNVAYIVLAKLNACLIYTIIFLKPVCRSLQSVSAKGLCKVKKNTKIPKKLQVGGSRSYFGIF